MSELDTQKTGNKKESTYNNCERRGQSLEKGDSLGCILITLGSVFKIRFAVFKAICFSCFRNNSDYNR